MIRLSCVLTFNRKVCKAIYMPPTPSWSGFLYSSFFVHIFFLTGEKNSKLILWNFLVSDLWFIIPISLYPSLFASLPWEDSPSHDSTHFLPMDANICPGSSFEYCRMDMRCSLEEFRFFTVGLDLASSLRISLMEHVRETTERGPPSPTERDREMKDERRERARWSCSAVSAQLKCLRS